MSILKLALVKTIAAVEQLPEDTVFAMGNSNLCVLGKTDMWYYRYGRISYVDTFALLFGISLATRQQRSNLTELGRERFGCVSKQMSGFILNSKHMDYFETPMYSQKEWEVIRLFTSAVAPCDDETITRNHWLHLASIQLEKMV